MTKEKLEPCIIKMIVENGTGSPLSFFSSEGFQDLNGELASKLGVSLDRHDVRKLVITKAKQQKEALKKELLYMTNFSFSNCMLAQDTESIILQ